MESFYQRVQATEDTMKREEERNEHLDKLFEKFSKTKNPPITLDSIDRDLTLMQLYLQATENIADDKQHLATLLGNITQYAVGDIGFLPILNRFVEDINQKQPATGFAILLQMENDLLSGGFATKNDIVTHVATSGLYGGDTLKFSQNFETVQSGISKSVKFHQSKRQAEYVDNIDALLKRHTDILDGTETLSTDMVLPHRARRQEESVMPS